MNLDGPAGRSFPVVEVFGPTIQGEGPLAGSVSHFVRFGGCDFACSWCDSAPAVLVELVRKAERLTIAQVLSKVKDLPPAKWVTLSGGNPGLHDLETLVNELHFAGFQVAVETQGSRWKDWFNYVDQLTISPKPPSSGMVNERFEEFMHAVHARSNPAIKVPIFDQADFDFAKDLHLKYTWYPFYLSVVTSMGGLRGDFNGGYIDEVEDILNRYHEVINMVLADPSMINVKVIPQLHALVWGHKRGH